MNQSRILSAHRRRPRPVVTRTEFDVIFNTANMAKRIQVVDAVGKHNLRQDTNGERYLVRHTGVPLCEIQASLDRYMEKWVAEKLGEFMVLYNARIKKRAVRALVTMKMVGLLKTARTHAMLGGWEFMGQNGPVYRTGAGAVGRGGLTNAQKKAVREFVQMWIWTGLNIVICNIEDRINGIDID